MIEKRVFCDICKQPIKSSHLRYILRRRLIEYDWIGQKKTMDICEDCYCRLVDMAAKEGRHDRP